MVLGVVRDSEVTLWGQLEDISSIKFCIFVPTETNTREQLTKECYKCGIANEESLLPKKNLSLLPRLKQTSNSWKKEVRTVFKQPLREIVGKVAKINIHPFGFLVACPTSQWKRAILLQF